MVDSKSSLTIWPETCPVPQRWIEFEVDSLDVAGQAHSVQGSQLLVDNRQEPWRQTVSACSVRKGCWWG